VSVNTLTIDGKMVTGMTGETLFDVAWNNGVRIPRLCHVGGISEVGACRLCLVEIEGQGKLVASCRTQVQEGMVVRTDTARLQAHRRLIVELLFAERNHVCAVCVQNGNCELQELAASLGVDHVRLRYQFPRLPVDTSHERFGLDHDDAALARHAERDVRNYDPCIACAAHFLRLRVVREKAR
jgi:bidirectional [NiFe] hydrogenase diaphorase subunit